MYYAKLHDENLGMLQHIVFCLHI